MKIIGLNLAVSKQSNTGFCILSEEVEVIKTLKSDEEIIGAVESFAPDIVAIATPLSFPEKGNWRKAEAELDKKKIKFTAPRGLISMEKLTLRGISLKEHFQNKGFLVIEVHAGAFCDLLKIPREKNYLHMKRLLKIYGLKLPKREFLQVELDAVTAAFTARLFLDAKVEFLGSEDEGQIVVPKVRR